MRGIEQCAILRKQPLAETNTILASSEAKCFSIADRMPSQGVPDVKSSTKNS